MLGFRAYWRELFRLLRGAADNPLVRAGAPWRFGWAPGLFAAAQVLAGIAVVLTCGYLLANAVTEESTPWGFHNRINFILVIPMLSAIACYLVGYPVNLLAYASHWRDPHRLEELYLTQLSNRELAFGSIFWACVVGSIVPLFCTLSVVLMWFTIIALRALSGTGPTEYLEVGWYLFVLALVGLSLAPLALAAALKVWFRIRSHHWTVLFTAPLLGSYFFFVAFFFAVGLLNLIDWVMELWIDDETSFSILLVVMLLFGAAYLRSAGRLAPSHFIRPIDETNCLRESFLPSDLLRFHRRELRRPIRLRLREVNPVPWVPATFATLLVAMMMLLLLTFGYNSFLLAGSLDLGRSMNNVFSVAIVYIGATMALFHYIVSRSPGKRLSLVSGALLEGLARMNAPLTLAMTMALFVLGYGDMVTRIDPYSSLWSHVLGSLLILVWCTGIALIVTAMAAWTFSVRGALRWARMAACIACPMLLLALLIRITNPRHELTFWSPSAIEVILALFILPFVLLLYNSAGMFQALYARELRGLPVGASNIDPPTGETPLASTAEAR